MGSNPTPSANLPPQLALRSAAGSSEHQVPRASRGEAVDCSFAAEGPKPFSPRRISPDLLTAGFRYGFQKPRNINGLLISHSVSFANCLGRRERLAAESCLDFQGRSSCKVQWSVPADDDALNDATGLCCPSIALLARELGVSQRTIQRALDQLINGGWFSKRRRGYRGMQYIPNYEWRVETPVEESETNWTSASEKPDMNDVTSRTRVSTKPIHQPNSEPSEEQEGVFKAESVSEPALCADPFASSVWNAHRNKLIATIGEGNFMVWLDPLTPVSDDGSTLVLAASTSFSVESVTLNFRNELERVLGRRVVVVERSWTADAYKRRLSVPSDREPTLFDFAANDDET